MHSLMLQEINDTLCVATKQKLEGKEEELTKSFVVVVIAAISSSIYVACCIRPHHCVDSHLHGEIASK